MSVLSRLATSRFHRGPSTLAGLPRPETALAAIVLMGVAVGAYLYRGLDGARIELLALGDKVGVAQDDIRAMQDVGAARSEEVGKRREELSLLEARQAEQEGRSGSGLPTRPEALGLSVQLTAYATEHSLLIGSFETTDGSVTVGDAESPAVRYALVARGSADSLVGLLRVVDAVPTARVDRLELTRETEDAGQWTMDLELAVVYGDEG